jgi:hypothetical protein
MAKFKSMEKELKILRKQSAKSMPPPAKDRLRTHPSGTDKTFQPVARRVDGRNRFDPPSVGAVQVSESSDDDSTAVTATDSTRNTCK